MTAFAPQGFCKTFRTLLPTAGLSYRQSPKLADRPEQAQGTNCLSMSIQADGFGS